MPIVHFEFHVDDVERAKTFYATVFGWDFEQYLKLPYWVVKADGIGANEPVSGALLPRNAPAHLVHTGPRGAIGVFNVDNVDVRYGKALEMGGGEALPPADYEGVGRLAYIEDGEGNLVGMITRQM